MPGLKRRGASASGPGEQATFLSSILEASTEYSIIATDLEGRILAWNEGARRIYGYNPADVVNKADVFRLHDPDDVRSGLARARLEEARASGKWSGELSQVRKDGSRFTASRCAADPPVSQPASPSSPATCGRAARRNSAACSSRHPTRW